MRKLMALVLVLLSLSVGLANDERRHSRDKEFLEFDKMAGVSGPFLGPANAIRGIPGAGAPWVISRVDGKLRTNGKLELEILLIFA